MSCLKYNLFTNYCENIMQNVVIVLNKINVYLDRVEKWKNEKKRNFGISEHVCLLKFVYLNFGNLFFTCRNYPEN